MNVDDFARVCRFNDYVAGIEHLIFEELPKSIFAKDYYGIYDFLSNEMSVRVMKHHFVEYDVPQEQKYLVFTDLYCLKDDTEENRKEFEERVTQLSQKIKYTINTFIFDDKEMAYLQFNDLFGSLSFDISQEEEEFHYRNREWLRRKFFIPIIQGKNLEHYLVEKLNENDRLTENLKVEVEGRDLKQISFIRFFKDDSLEKLMENRTLGFVDVDRASITENTFNKEVFSKEREKHLNDYIETFRELVNEPFPYQEEVDYFNQYIAQPYLEWKNQK